ncbi:hypothetical protein ACFV1F_02115 [Streptomyces sp. NPDC059590]|uniref:hypothetical protein n=1 Tax=Streptomyces sp. NPDC059590 TaxID=3346877 RepID=UPI0036B8E930
MTLTRLDARLLAQDQLPGIGDGLGHNDGWLVRDRANWLVAEAEDGIVAGRVAQDTSRVSAERRHRLRAGRPGALGVRAPSLARPDDRLGSLLPRRCRPPPWAICSSSPSRTPLSCSSTGGRAMSCARNRSAGRRSRSPG